MTVIDHADDGYNLSQEAMNNLTCVGFLIVLSSVRFADVHCSDGHAVDWGVVDGSGVQVPNSLCGLA